MARSSAFSGGFDETAFRDVWLAGLYEGEGTCSFVRDHLQFQIKMTDEDVIRRAHDVAGVGQVYGPYSRKHWKPYWVFIVVNAADVQNLLGRLRPFLMSRRIGQVDTAIAEWKAWRKAMPSDESRFWDKVIDDGEHHRWTGAVARGYGRVWIGGGRADPADPARCGRPHQDLAHRVAWRMSGRELAPYKNLRNKCGLATCVKPEHWTLNGA